MRLFRFNVYRLVRCRTKDLYGAVLTLIFRLMSALGQKRTFRSDRSMSGLIPPKERHSPTRSGCLLWVTKGMRRSGANSGHVTRGQQNVAAFLFAFGFLKEVPSAAQCQHPLYSRTYAVRIRQKAGFARIEMSKEGLPAPLTPQAKSPDRDRVARPLSDALHQHLRRRRPPRNRFAPIGEWQARSPSPER